ncbi:transcription antitermination factor NusB [Nitrosomonas halophila]|jgi:transcription antitermination protein NusB|uniref:Transcription antitermination protein NusB n=1 Tax=Nitrosomonas halophila TaxID=44576 RepID=A0A1H3C3C0_9PROT|nr:transcription antitermination factor NusB [Nitrosomonas halophila]SDX48398.1 N utilization substance protein B [Nitrosomonas halophila]
MTLTDSVAPAKPAPKFKKRRHLSRELALQGIYQWRLAGGNASDIDAQLREAKIFSRVDAAYFADLLYGVLEHVTALQAQIQPCLDRQLSELSPVEFSILSLSTYELVHHPEIPYRAVINEAIELAKSYGGTDGHKYVNGVLDKLASRLRPEELALHRTRPLKQN